MREVIARFAEGSRKFLDFKPDRPAASTARLRSGRPCRVSRPALPYAGTGGDVLFVEATSSEGRKLVLTGQLAT